MADEPKPKSPLKAGQLIEKYRARALAEQKARKAAEKERDEAKARPSSEDLQKQVDGYRAADKDRAYREVFNAECTAAGITGANAQAAAWKLAGVDQAADKPDAAKLKAAVAACVAENDFLKAPAGGTTPPPEPKLGAGQGSGRGTPVGGEVAGKFPYSKDNLADGLWMQQNRDKLNAAFDAGTAQLIS